MKKKISLLLLFFNTIYSQNLPQDKFISTITNKVMNYNYLGGNENLLSLFFNNINENKILFSTYSGSIQGTNWRDTQEINSSFTFFLTSNKDMNFIEGYLYNNSNIIINGSVINEESEKNTFIETDDFFEIKDFICREIFIQKEDAKLVFYVTDLKDDFDYNNVMLFIKEFIGNEELPVLKKGEIIVEVGVLNNSSDAYSQYISLNNIIDENNVFNLNNEHFLSYIKGKNYSIDEEYKNPIYCQSFDLNNNYSKKYDEPTITRIDNFYREMCIYFDEFGRYNNEDFCRFYISYKDYLIKFFKEKNILNSNQIKNFSDEISKNIKNNLKENLSFEPIAR